MSTSANGLPTLAHLGGTQALTTAPIVGTPSTPYPDVYVPGAEALAAGEIRVTVLGSGDPFIKRSQASGSLLIEVGNPDEKAYREIFRRVCDSSGIPYVDQAVTYLMEHYYKPREMALRACHPRDLVSLVRDAARYRQIPPSLSRELIDQACKVFLVDL